MAQLILPLEFRSAAFAERILVGNGNAQAVEALRNPGNWPFNSAVLTGPARSGKSLLGRWFSGSGLGEVLDDVESLPEEQVFHRWNRAQDGGAALLMIANSAGEGWNITLPDLRSRVGGSLQLRLAEPDDEMVGALIESHASQIGLVLTEGAVPYLVPRVTRSYAAIEQLVAAINRLSLERQTPARMGIWREALELGGDAP